MSRECGDGCKASAFMNAGDELFQSFYQIEYIVDKSGLIAYNQTKILQNLTLCNLICKRGYEEL